MSNSYNNTGIIVNPVLRTFPADEINIQPYWLVVLQLLVSQFSQRIWHYFRYKTLFTTLEIAGLIRIFQNRRANKMATDRSVPVAFVDTNPNKSGNHHIESATAIDTRGTIGTTDEERLKTLRSMIVIDYFDALNCLLTLGHAIWYCIIQSTCVNATSSAGTHWNCYNALGYRLFNYVFVSYFTTTLDCVYKAYMLGYKEVMNTDAERGSCRWVSHYTTLIIIGLSLLFTTCLMLPFIFTNVIPMFIMYIWMSLIYIGVCAYLVYSSIKMYKNIKELPGKVEKKNVSNDDEEHNDQHEYCSFMFTTKEMPQVAASMLLAMVITTFPILLSIYYNYTQFYYFGESYLKSIEDDHLTRDTINYFNVIRNSAAQSLHLALNLL